jgi:hypothetical protein
MEENQQTSEKEQLSISSFSITFGDLSNLESLINEADEKVSKKGLSVEHFAEMKRIIKRVKNNKNA